MRSHRVSVAGGRHLPRLTAGRCRLSCGVAVQPMLEEEGRRSGASSPTVTLVVRTNSPARLVLRAINSALGQTYPNLGVVVVDDGSADRRIRFFVRTIAHPPSREGTGHIRGRALRPIHRRVLAPGKARSARWPTVRGACPRQRRFRVVAPAVRATRLAGASSRQELQRTP